MLMRDPQPLDNCDRQHFKFTIKMHLRLRINIGGVLAELGKRSNLVPPFTNSSDTVVWKQNLSLEIVKPSIRNNNLHKRMMKFSNPTPKRWRRS